ncbi:MAG: hypothetical protein ABJQ29_05790 [Luteolibacter sp.]
MKSFLMFLIAFVVLIAVVGGGGVLFYLASTSEYNRAPETPPTSAPSR